MVEQEMSIARGIEEREGKLVWTNLRVRYDERKGYSVETRKRVVLINIFNRYTAKLNTRRMKSVVTWKKYYDKYFVLLIRDFI